MIRISILFSAVFLFSMSAYSWSVSKVKGTATVSRAGELVPVEVGLALVASDVVETKSSARVMIQEGNNRIWLGANTKFKVGEFEGRRNAPKKVQTLSVLTGKIRSIIQKKKDSREQYKFKTPTAVAGVRGTEFFIESTESGEFFCTLNGSIEVQTNDGEDFVVEEGKGLRFALGEPPNLSGTSSFLVDRWVAETSFEDQILTSQDVYPVSKRKTRLNESSNIYYGGFASVYYCGKDNSDFDDTQDDDNKDCFRYYVSPFIQVGDSQGIFFRPAFVGTYANTYGLIDEVPATNKKEANAFTIAEAYYQDQLAGWSFKAGFQEVQWADGILLSTKKSAIEPITHLALTASTQLNDYELDVLAGPGVGDSEELLGHSHIATLGAKLKMPQDRGEIYLLHANFGERDGRSYLYHGQEFMNYGYYFSKRKDMWDASVSLIHQDLHQFYNASGARSESQATATDVQIGRQLGMARPARASIRHIKTGRNFVPIQEDFYTLSNGMIVSHRSNLEQFRAKLEIQVVGSQQVFVEYMKSSQVSPTGFRTFVTGATNKDEDIGEEYVFSHIWTVSSNLTWTNALWSFSPNSNLLGDDSAIGLNSRILYTY